MATSLVIFILTEIISRSTIAQTVSNSQTDHLFLITQDWRVCTSLGKEYEEIEAFETENFYVNLCRKGDRYFYIGEDKTSQINSIFLPAYTDDQQNYRADNGNLSYLITLNPNQDTLAVEQNGHQIDIEQSITKYCSAQHNSLSLKFESKPNYNSTKMSISSDRLPLPFSLLDRKEHFDFQQQQISYFNQTSSNQNNSVLYRLENQPSSSLSCS
jgi:hypothetical protein